MLPLQRQLGHLARSSCTYVRMTSGSRFSSVLAAAAALSPPISVNSASTSTAVSASAAGEFPEAVAPVVSAIESGLRALHDTVGLPWWATFAVAALAAKGLLLPVVWAGLRHGERGQFVAAYGAPIRRHITHLPIPSRWLVQMVAAREALMRARFSPSLMLLNPCLQISAWVLLAMTCRAMLTVDPTMTLGGFGPFLDLTLTNTHALPAMAMTVMFVNVELAFGSLRAPAAGEVQTPMAIVARRLLSGLRMAPLLAFPFLVAAPQGVCCYIIPSSLFALAQATALRRPGVRRMLGLMPPPPPLSPLKPTVIAAASATGSANVIQ
jgi:YidC/Oxa1 family membrane protein insertase